MAMLFMLLLPLFVDLLILQMVPISTLNKEDALIKYLKGIQGDPKIMIGVHGWLHKCPLCGNTTHEFVCPRGEIPIEEIERRVDLALNSFRRVGLYTEWWCFPGEAVGPRVIDVLEKRGFITVEYTLNPCMWPSALLVHKSVYNETKWFLPINGHIEEYTWMWRKPSVVKQKYNESLYRVLTDPPDCILLHCQDLRPITFQWLETVLSRVRVKCVRVDDFTVHNTEICKKIVNLCRKYDMPLLLAIIPTHKMIWGNPLVTSTIRVSWYFFVFGFIGINTYLITFAHLGRKIKYSTPMKLRNGGGLPFFSLVSPAYNESKNIVKCIETILKQDYIGKSEAVIINDGSTDNTGEIIRQYELKYPNKIKGIHHKKNLGKPEALNTGFRMANGDITVFFDSDSHLAPDFVSKIAPHFHDPEVGMVAGMIVIENDNTLLTKLQQMEYLYSQLVVRFSQAMTKSVLICPGAGSAVRTEIARKIKSTDRTITEDADFTFMISEDGWKISQEIDAVSYTTAPVTIRHFLSQRARWLYGVWQTLRLHKQRIRNPWVFWAWTGYVLNPISIFFFTLAFVLFSWYKIGFFLFWAVYTAIAFIYFAVTRYIPLTWYNNGEKKHLVIYMPLYAIYQIALNLFLFILMLCWATRIGIRVRYGGKIVHAL